MKRSEIRKRKQKSKRKKYVLIIGIIIVAFGVINFINVGENKKDTIPRDSTEKAYRKIFGKGISKKSQNVDNDSKSKKRILKKNITEKKTKKQKDKPKKKIIQKKITEKETRKQKSRSKKKQKKETDVKDNSSKKNNSRKINRLENINTEIQKRLEEDKGFSLGELDENGHPTQNGTPNFAFAWSVVVKRIEYNDNGDKASGNITVYVNSSFKELSIKERDQVALKSQNLAVNIIGEDYKYSMEEYRKGLLTSVNCDSHNVGRSEYFNLKEFKWNTKYFD